VVITMPTHPFFGQTLVIARLERSSHNKRYILVEHPKGGFLRLPIEWTDRSSSKVPPKFKNRILKAGIRELLKLSHACDAALKEDLDFASLRTKLGENPETNSDQSNGLGATSSNDFGRATENVGQCLGDSCAQNAEENCNGGAE